MNPLEFAIRWGNVNVVKMILRHSSNSESLETILCFAHIFSDISLIRRLEGENTEIYNNFSCDALLDIAAKCSHLSWRLDNSNFDSRWVNKKTGCTLLHQVMSHKLSSGT